MLSKVRQTLLSLFKHAKCFMNVYFVCVLLFVASLPFHFKLNNIAIILVTVVWLYGLITRKIQLNTFFRIRANILFVLVFLFYCIGLLYSDHVIEGLQTIERQLAFILFPLVLLPLQKVSLPKFRYITNAFVLACLLASLIALTGALLKTVQSQSLYTLNPDTGVNEYHFYYHQLTEHIGVHAVFFSLYVAFSHLIVTHRICTNFKASTKGVNVFNVFLFLFFPIILYLSNSITIIVAWLLCLCLILASVLKKQQHIFKRKAFILAACIVLPVLAYMGSRIILEKIDVTKIGNFNFSDDIHSGNWGTLNTRLAKWECASEVFMENFWTGTGTGDEMPVLLEKYEEKQFWIGIQNRFDPHNQFLRYGISLGIFAIILFITILTWQFKQAVDHKNILFISFLVLFILFSLTESTLASNKGIVFYVFFSLYFIHSSKRMEGQKN